MDFNCCSFTKNTFVLFFLLFTLFGIAMVNNVAAAQIESNLKKYRSQNLALIESKNNVEVVILGDSITESWVRMRPHFFEQQDWYGRGISGETTTQMLLRFEQDVVSLSPKLVVIIAGTNDVAENGGPYSEDLTLSNLKAMVELAESAGIYPVLAKVLPATEFGWSPGKNPKVKIPALNRKITAYAKTRGIHLVDFYSVMVSIDRGMRESYSDDGVHPNVWGYLSMETLLKEELEKIL